MTYNDDAPGDSTPPQQESKMHIGSKVTLISDEGSIGLISKRDARLGIGLGCIACGLIPEWILQVQRCRTGYLS